MKSVLASIIPKYCELIAAGHKTVEVRKGIPKLTPPFTVYIYQTKRSWAYKLLEHLCLSDLADRLRRSQQKVIGEFVCDRYIEYVWIPDEFPWSKETDGSYYLTDYDLESTCLTMEEFVKYGKGEHLYGWHISDLEFYDKPVKLSNFHKPVMPTDLRYEADEINRAPQSWCYVEEVA